MVNNSIQETNVLSYVQNHKRQKYMIFNDKWQPPTYRLMLTTVTDECGRVLLVNTLKYAWYNFIGNDLLKKNLKCRLLFFASCCLPNINLCTVVFVIFNEYVTQKIFQTVLFCNKINHKKDCESRFIHVMSLKYLYIWQFVRLIGV